MLKTRTTLAVLSIIALCVWSCSASKPDLPDSVKQALAKAQQARQNKADVAPDENTVTATRRTTTTTPDTTAAPSATELQSDSAEMTEAEKAVHDHRVNQSLVDTSNIKLTTGKLLSIPKEGASESPRNDNIHDPQNDAIKMLQDPTVAMAKFPRDRRNQVNWVQTLDQGLINPRADLKGETQMLTMDMDILMKNTQFMPWVKFPHLQHTKWLACQNCHPKIFIPQENANPISMNKVLRGEYCGVCHDKVAFALFTCERCHSVPHPGSGPKWW